MAESATPFGRLKNELKKIAARKDNRRIKVPALWNPVGRPTVDGGNAHDVRPAEFFLEHLEAIEKHRLPSVDPTRSLNTQIPGGEGGSWVGKGAIYNLFVRLGTAYDHNGDGLLGGGKDPTLNGDGVRESGTFLKSIALLGHIRTLGCTTIHLLPVTSIGRDGNKGNLGSPYAIKNVYELEPSQADPLVPLSVEDQFKAFIEAAHMLGMRVVCEFVFRTASKDADWVTEHPDWFYWIDAAVPDREPGEKDLEKAKRGYGNPIFDDATLVRIKEQVTRSDFHNMPAPPAEYRRFFKLPPTPGKVAINGAGQMRGQSIDPENGKTVETRIPGAFADWPPDDNQPPWGDVTYLRMYNDEDPKQPRFNYIAYNTIRMYDTALAQDRLANRPLWEKIRDLIPHYQHTYGIDGVMVDMGHAVPVNLMREIVDTARKVDPNFAFLSENFEINEHSVHAGYNVVVGYAWWVEYKRDGMNDLLNHVGERGVPLPFFGAVENHNTPRACGRPGGERYAKYAFLANTFLPRSVPFIHGGFELGETMPVNTGLDFSNTDLENLRGKPLALFDLCGMKWDGSPAMLAFTRRVLQLRQEYKDAAENLDWGNFVRLESGHPDVFAFVRRGGYKNVLVLFNRDLENPHECRLDLRPFGAGKYEALQDQLAPKDAVWALQDGQWTGKITSGNCHCLVWND